MLTKLRICNNDIANGSRVRLKDVAEISDAIKDPTTLARTNGQEALLVNLLKQGDANAIDVSDMVETHHRTFESSIRMKG